MGKFLTVVDLPLYDSLIPSNLAPLSRLVCNSVDIFGRSLDSQNVLARVNEVVNIFLDMEANNITFEQGFQDCVTMRQNRKEIGAWERCVQEESDSEAISVLQRLREQTRKEHQMIVVYPDNIVVPYVRYNSLAEQLVDLSICLTG